MHDIVQSMHIFECDMPVLQTSERIRDVKAAETSYYAELSRALDSLSRLPTGLH